MKRIVLALVVMFSVGSVMAQQKMAHVNSQKLLDTLPSRKAAISQLKAFEQSGVTELQEMEADFNKQIAVYEKNRPTMSPVIIKIEEEKLMKKQQALQEREQSLNTEMQAVSQELNKPILERVQKAVEIVSDRKKLSYVIDESSTLYFKGGMDITNEVVTELLRLDAESLK